MRILHCIPSTAGGGAERQLSYLLGGLTALGFDNHVAFTRRGENHPRFESSGAVLHEISVAGHHSPAWPLALHQLIRRSRPALVQTWLPQMDLVAGAVALWNRLPWILSERNSAASYPGTLKHRLRLHLGARATAVVANSATGLAYWKGHLGESTLQRIIPNALPLGEIRDSAPLSDAAAGASSGEKLILYAGRLHPSKNLDALLLALRELRDRIPFKAVVCGQGPYRTGVESAIARFGLEQHVTLKGYVSNTWSWMKRADVFVSPSFTEGQPNTVMEAMACRCPLVVSSIPEHREFLDGTSALLVDPNDSQLLAEAISRSLTSPAEATRRCEAAFARAAQWSVTAMAEHYSALYYELHERCAATSSAAANRSAKQSAAGQTEASTG